MSVLAQDAGVVLLGARTCAAAAASGVVVLVLAARPWRGRAEAPPAWGPPLALSAAAAAGFWTSRGSPSFPPAQSLHWLFYVALAGCASGLFEAVSARGGRLARAPLALLLPLVLLEFQRARHWGRVEGILWSAGLAVWLLVSWNALAALEQRKGSSAALALGLALATALCAGVYRFAGGSLFALLPASLALGLAACALLGRWRRAPALGAPGVAPFVLLHFGLVWTARWLYSLSSVGFVLLSLVPLAATLSLLAATPRTRTRAMLELWAPALLAAAALLHEWLSMPAWSG